MIKIKIRLITLGQLPAQFDKTIIQKHRSSVYQLIGDIENFSLNIDSDGDDWEYSDQLLSKQVTEKFVGDFLIAITNIPLEDNYYTRRLSGNRVVFTFHEIKDYLIAENIPLENMIFRLLYGYSLVFRRSGNLIPEISSLTNFAHDETRGCLFDMNGLKSDIVHSCVKPIICEKCKENLKQEKVSNDMITHVQKEIKDFNKKRYYVILDFVKANPILAIFISSLTAIVLGVIGSIIGSFIYESIK